ncbi:NrfD/PsrC family molybdoenzyme membrane anchor subunit [Fibrobacter sp.]|uniref:NrfD/PsrC family molybdoenzyme membrane anchor subunit n=1 Tax=Fibrobacter sp. TaxID=35828 RepID=UPI00388FF66D
MFRYLMLAGLALFLPGLYALGDSLYQGPSAWMVDSQTFWGTPISLFVFWIGLAHAGTLLSAIFLALGIKLDRRTALIAELSTLVSLVFAGIFPLMHLGVVENFYMVAPFLDARGNFANVRSPLVWDFCCIAVYAFLSLFFFTIHLKSREIPVLERYRKPLAWLLFPLVLWVHTIVSLDFAATFVPQWRGAFFPLYFIAGAILSGLALVNLLLYSEGYRVRLLERLMLAGSWVMVGFWFWEFLTKGIFCTSAFIFAGVLPQLRVVSFIREHRTGRILLSISVLLGLFLERYFLVSPMQGMPGQVPFGWVDAGLVAFSVGGFMLLFFGMRQHLSRSMESEGTYFGEVDGSEMAMVEEAARESSELSREKKRGIDLSYIQPWSSDEYKVLRLPLLVGFAAALVFSLWVSAQLPFAASPYENIEVAFANIVPLFYPIAALIAAGVLFLAILHHLRQSPDSAHVTFARRISTIFAAILVVFAAVAGTFYAGGASRASAESVEASPLNVENPIEKYIREMSNESAEASVDTSANVSAESLPATMDSAEIEFIWNARCAKCHGVDGRFNEKFVREYYPVPQKLDAARIDSLGLDSLEKVVLDGRVNMSAYRGRLTEAEVRGLVAYMRHLAGDLNSSSAGDSAAVDSSAVDSAAAGEAP